MANGSTEPKIIYLYRDLRLSELQKLTPTSPCQTRH